MKALKLLLLSLLFIIPLHSQTIIHNTTQLYVDYYDGNGYIKYDTNTNIITDFDNNIISIDTIESYYVNFVERKEFKNYKLLNCSCLDSEGNSCLIQYFLYEKFYYLKVTYSDMCFKYKIYYKDLIYDNSSKIYWD